MSLPTTANRDTPLSRGHFTALLSMIMALAALGIDMMLPALDDMREHFGLAPDSSQVARVVTAFLIGLALAQYFYGPLADRFGRKPVLYAGLLLYAIGALGAAVAPTLELVLVSRVIWGVGAASPRVVSVSIVRDVYTGEEMAKAMSYILAIFIMVPVLAPSIGAALIAVFPWQSVFVFGAVAAVVVAVWARLLPETLDPADQRPLNRAAIFGATREVLTNRQAFGYTLARTLTFGAFSSYLASSERIFGDIYGRPDQFPLIFGGIAAVMGAAMFTNGKLVDRIGTKRIVHGFLISYVIGGFIFWGVTAAADGQPSFWTFVLGLAMIAFMHTLLIPNFNTIAMWPMGHIAGTASAVIGTMSVAGGALIGAVIDQQYTDSVSPLVIAFAVLGGLAFLSVLWAERGKLFAPPEPAPPPVETIEPPVR
jgi:DHA1 family bicyclomycin/chloramphenicol resistance-like MFS transporter